MTDQSNDSAKVQLSEPMSLLGRLIEHRSPLQSPAPLRVTVSWKLHHRVPLSVYSSIFQHHLQLLGWGT